MKVLSDCFLVLVDAAGGSAGYLGLTSWSRTMRRVKAALPLVCSGERHLCQVMGTGLCGSGSLRFHGSRRALKAKRNPEPPKDCIPLTTYKNLQTPIKGC